MGVNMKFIPTNLMFAALVVTIPSEEASAKGRWQQVENKADCAVWNEEPASNESVTWTGKCKKGKANGNGKLVWRYYSFPKWKGRIRGWRESTYIGSMRGGMSNGRGVLTWPGGEKYDGEWTNNKREGKGAWITASGERCEGIWHNQKMVGQGTTEQLGKKLPCVVIDGEIRVND